jgi:hypothetical protein
VLPLAKNKLECSEEWPRACPFAKRSTVAANLRIVENKTISSQLPQVSKSQVLRSDEVSPGR